MYRSSPSSLPRPIRANFFFSSYARSRMHADFPGSLCSHKRDASPLATEFMKPSNFSCSREKEEREREGESERKGKARGIQRIVELNSLPCIENTLLPGGKRWRRISYDPFG